MNNDEMNKLSEALELSESQRLALYNYSERDITIVNEKLKKKHKHKNKRKN